MLVVGPADKKYAVAVSAKYSDEKKEEPLKEDPTYREDH